MRWNLSALGAVALLGLGCADVRESFEAGAVVAQTVQTGDAEALCERFTEDMANALSCERLGALLQETRRLAGAPVGACSWAFTYRIQTIDPLRSGAIYTCPFERETVKVTVGIEVRDHTALLAGLWLDSPSLRRRHATPN